MGDPVLNGPLLAALAVALAAGVVSFASPCVLPLVPGFLGYVGWVAGASRGLRTHHDAIQRFSGVVLVVLGLLLVSGVWETFTAWVQTQLVSSFTTVL